MIAQCNERRAIRRSLYLGCLESYGMERSSRKKCGGTPHKVCKWPIRAISSGVSWRAPIRLITRIDMAFTPWIKNPSLLQHGLFGAGWSLVPRLIAADDPVYSWRESGLNTDAPGACGTANPIDFLRRQFASAHTTYYSIRHGFVLLGLRFLRSYSGHTPIIQ